LLDGMQFALDHFRFGAIITMDGDGQHRPEDIPKAITALNEYKDFVIGVRDFSSMPLRSRLGNTVTSSLFNALHRDCPTDTQSGFRAFSPGFTNEVLSFVGRGRYETELYTLLLALTRRVGVGTFKIDTIYLDQNRSSHFRPIADSMRIMLSLIRWQIGTFF